MTPAILLVDHGSRRAEANEVLDGVANRLRQRLPDCQVAVAHMELAPPSIQQAIDDLVRRGASQIVVHPYFLAPGAHSHRDVPDLVKRAAAQHPGVDVRVSAPLGVHDGIVDAVLDRVREAAKREARDAP